MQIFKNVRVIAIILLLLISTYFIASPFIFRKSGVAVASISKDSQCGLLKEGDVITQVGGMKVRTLEDFKSAISSVKSGEYVAMVINGGPGDCIAVGDGDLGLVVSGTPSKQLNFGIDIQGGIATKIGLDGGSAPTDLNSTAQTIQKRISALGIPQTYVTISDGTINIVSLTNENINLLVEPGKFDARIAQEIDFENSTATIKVGNRLYNVEGNDTKLIVNGNNYSSGQIFTLEDIEFNLINVTNKSFIIEAGIFSNRGITRTAPGYVSYNSNSKNYEFYIPVEISKDAGEKFLKIAKGLKSTLVETQMMLQGQLVYSLDGESISRLNIPYEMTTKEISSISIIGFGNSNAQTAYQKNKVLAMIQSNELPETLKILGTELVEPKTKSTVIYASSLFAIILASAVALVFYFRYKNLKYGGYALLMILIEIAIIIGVAAITQGIYYPGWIIDFQTIVGIMIIAMLGFIQLIIISEKLLKSKVMNLNYKYKTLISFTTLLNISVLFVSFILLFTAWKGIGLSMLIGLLVEVALTRSVFKDISKI